MGSADNAVNGVPACADSWLLQTVARDTWNFSGYVTSDCDADSDVFVSHNYTKTAEEAVANILHAGTDLDCEQRQRPVSFASAAVAAPATVYADAVRLICASCCYPMQVGALWKSTRCKPCWKNRSHLTTLIHASSISLEYVCGSVTSTWWGRCREFLAMRSARRKLWRLQEVVPAKGLCC
eukprot:COSAG05_NODE_2733_length_2714_cov_13.830210_1_plen_181_part_00